MVQAIAAKDAIGVARSLIGTPYKNLDCINLIKKVIRTSPGGVKSYTTAGTNSLWDSFHFSAKYRDLTWRKEGITGACAGMLAFKRYGADDEGHVGLVTESGTVIHSSSVGGRGVVETPLSSLEGWDLLAVHRYIGTDSAGTNAQTDEKADEETNAETGTETEETPSGAMITIVDSAGRRFAPQGDWRVLIGGID